MIVVLTPGRQLSPSQYVGQHSEAYRADQLPGRWRKRSAVGSVRRGGGFLEGAVALRNPDCPRAVTPVGSVALAFAALPVGAARLAYARRAAFL